MRLPLLIKWAAIGWTIAIFIGCAMPFPDTGGPHFTVSDKTIHVAIFALWGFLWVAVWRQPMRLFWIGVLYGFLIECYQGLMPINRSFDWFDLLADSIGVLLGILVSLALTRMLIKS